MRQMDLLLVNYNTKNLVQRFIDHINRDWEPGVWNLHIIDNGSSDGSKEILLDLFKDKDNHIASYTSGNNIGYSKAINFLAGQTNNEYLCAVNADTWFSTEHVKAVMQTFSRTPRAGVIGVKQMDENAKIRHGGIFYDGKTHPVHRGWDEPDPYDAKYKDLVQCWTVSGSIYYMRRLTWDELAQNSDFSKFDSDSKGAFLPTPHFFEETFFSVHAQKRGWEVWYDGTAPTAGHTWHASSEIGEASRKFFETSRDMYIDACLTHNIPNEFNGSRV